MKKQKLVRITTIPLSLEKLLENQLRFMSQYYEVIAISSDREKLAEVGKSQNAATYPLQLTRKITPVKDFFAVLKLFFYLKRVKPLIVHTHTPKAGTVGMLAAFFAGVPIRLHTVAGLPLLEAKGAKRVLLNFVEKLTYSCATKVYPNSIELMKIIVASSFCKREKLKVLGNGSSNGINIDYFKHSDVENKKKQELKDAFEIHENSFVFIFVGRLVGDKGINELIQAFQAVDPVKNNCKLLLVGNEEPDLDPLHVRTKDAISENANIINVGFQIDVRPLFAISHALVFPSYREGFPNVVMQAGSMGLPCIVSDINGCNEIIVHETNGLIVPVKNSEAISKAMERLMLDRDLYSSLRENSRKMVEERFEQNVLWNEILKEYKKLEMYVSKSP